MNKQEEYLKRVRNVIFSLATILSSDELARVEHLVKHNEPAEGLLSLTWIIHNNRKNISKEAISEILSLTSGLVLKEHFPPLFQQSIQ